MHLLQLPRLVSQLWLSHPVGGVVITIYNAIPSKNLRCQDALLEGAKPEPVPVETSLVNGEGGGGVDPDCGRYDATSSSQGGVLHGEGQEYGGGDGQGDSLGQGASLCRCKWLRMMNDLVI